MRLDVAHETFPLAAVFRISRGARSKADVLRASVSENGAVGQGECVPYPRYGESVESVAGLAKGLPLPLDKEKLQELLPAGAARNAVDCALWDLEAKASGKRAWQIAGLPEPKPQITAYTLSLDTPESMMAAAAKNASRPLLKIKLGGEEDVKRLEAVRKGAPDARIIIDANEGWTPEEYRGLAPHLVSLGVEMVEQPLPAGADGMLGEIERPLPVCADESCHDRGSLPGLKGKYDVVNIKLDKTGGLTEALLLRQEARAQGYRIMVGCMVGTSLAMAPALLVAQGADFTDLDGPLLLSGDRPNPLRYDDLGAHPSSPGLWG